MPQMNPMWWFSLFIIFIITLTITNSMNYFYSKNSVTSAIENSTSKKSINWKW